MQKLKKQQIVKNLDISIHLSFRSKKGHVHRKAGHDTPKI